MKRDYFVTCLSVIICSGFSGAKDLSDALFNDSIVNRYELKYYIANWVDTMKVNKEDSGEAYMPAKFIYRGPNGDSIVLDSIGVRYKGNSSYELSKDTPKKSFKLSFSEYRDQTFFGLERLNLNNNVLDPSQMREKISYDVARKYMPSPRASYATLTIEGKLVGLYTQVEQIDEHFILRNFPNADSTLGNLYKAGDNGAILAYKDFNQKSYESLYELKTNEKANDWSGFINMLYKLNSADSAKFIDGIKNYLDLDNCMKYLAWTVALSNFDSYTGSGRNYYVYDDPKTGRFFMIPWDNNMSFGLYTNGWNMINNSSVAIGNSGERPLTKKILGNDSLKAIYLRYLQEMINGPLSDLAIEKEADRILGIIDSAVKSEPAENAFFSYDTFLINIESDVEYMVPLSGKSVAFGIKSFPIERNEQLTRQIEAGVQFGRNVARPAISRMTAAYSRVAGTVIVHAGFSGIAPVAVSMYDGRGRLVRSSSSVSGATVSLKVADLVPGVYSIEATSQRASLCDRVIITK